MQGDLKDWAVFAVNRSCLGTLYVVHLPVVKGLEQPSTYFSCKGLDTLSSYISHTVSVTNTRLCSTEAVMEHRQSVIE